MLKADTDGDGLGDALEAALCLCSRSAETRCGFDCRGAATPQDSDGDGLPDWWEALYFGGNGNPNADPDGDGMSNLAEYRAGTNPTDRNSVFAFIRILPDPAGGLSVEWSSISNRTYVLQRSTNLPGGFVDLQTGIQGTPPMNSVRDASAVDPGPYFYRLRVQY